MSEGRASLSDSTPSKGPVQFPSKTIPNSASLDSLNMGLSELANMARRAFEEKRRKNCLALTSAILKIDPNHREALVIQAWVQSDLGQDLDRARTLADEARSINSLAAFDRAEKALDAILKSDPDNEEAKALMQDLLSASREVPPSELALPRPHTSSAVPPASPFDVAANAKRLLIPAVLVGLILVAVVAGVIGFGARRQPESAAAGGEGAAVGTLNIAMDDGIQVFVNDEFRGTTPLEALDLESGSYLLRYQQDGQTIGQEQVTVMPGKATRNTITSAVGGLNFIVVPRTGVRMVLDEAPAQPVPPSLKLKAGEHRMIFTADGYAPQLVTTTVTAGEDRNFVVALQPSGTIRPAAQSAAAETPLPARQAPPPPRPTPDTRAAAAPPPPPPEASVAIEYGTLALSAAVPVEIYSGDRLLGATPTTLQLPAGTHSLEFRYGQMRRTQSHEVRANQTTTATITFGDLTVQINARPFAQVFIDGVQVRPLGETPLSNVRVPIGSVLVFRHPSFPERRYRVTGGETTIQVSFQ